MDDSITEFSVELLSSVRRTSSCTSAGEFDAGASPRCAASSRELRQATNTCCATKRARSSASRSVWRMSRAMYRLETSATTAKTSSDVASVNLVFRLRRIFPPRLVFFQFVVKSLETDAQQVRRARLVLAGRRERLQNEFALHRIDGRADGEPNAAESRIRHGAGAAEVRRKMLSRDHASIGGDCRAFEHIAQLAHVAGPRI